MQPAATALALPLLRQLVATCDRTARGRRDRALLLIGFAGALRRSELVALQVEDVATVAGGLRLRLPRGKTDQAGQGAGSAPPAGSARPPCIPTPCAASSPTAPGWPGWSLRASSG